jgi:hypothetical protein
MVDEVLTSTARASPPSFLRFVLRLVPLLPAAFLAGLGAIAPGAAWADSPVVIEGADEDTRRAVLDLLPDRDTPASLFDAERIAEEAGGTGCFRPVAAVPSGETVSSAPATFWLM